jgi:hypothetical protein
VKLAKRPLHIDDEEIACEFSVKEKNAVILHGAGSSELTRFYAIAEELHRHGLGVVLFDFSGHGKSTGKLSEQSLQRRKEQAKAVMDEIVPQGRLYLAGFSMGAQTLCDILPTYKDRVEAVLLGCPAIYTEEARNIPFGNKEFTAKLREENSWENSKAPGLLKDFTGRTVIAIGDRDEIIPKGVVDSLKNSAQNSAYKECPGATHRLAEWLSENPKELSNVIASFLTR